MGLLFAKMLPDINWTSALLAFVFLVYGPYLMLKISDSIPDSSMLVSYLAFAALITIYTGIVLAVKAAIKKAQDVGKKPEDKSQCNLTFKGVLGSAIPWYIYSIAVIGLAITTQFVKEPILFITYRIIESFIGILVTGLVFYWPSMVFVTKCY